MTTLARGGRDLMYRSKPLFFLYSTDRSIYEHGFLSLIGFNAEPITKRGHRSTIIVNWASLDVPIDRERSKKIRPKRFGANPV
jgi:hypothetical protein